MTKEEILELFTLAQKELQAADTFFAMSINADEKIPHFARAKLFAQLATARVELAGMAYMMNTNYEYDSLTAEEEAK